MLCLFHHSYLILSCRHPFQSTIPFKVPFGNRENRLKCVLSVIASVPYKAVANLLSELEKISER